MNAEYTGYADLLMHTTASDGYASVRDLLHYVAETTRLDVIAITDHDVLDASLAAWEQQAHYPFDVVPGVEISSRDGHVLGLWVTQPVPVGLSLTETVAAIHEQGGLAVLAHPFEIFVHVRAAWRYLTRPAVLIETRIDAIEVHNSGAPTPGSNWLARRMAAHLGLTMTGSSDAHSLTSIGSGITRFPGQTALDLRCALTNRTTIVEGKAWPITDYLRLLPTTTRRKLSGSLGMNLR